MERESVLITPGRPNFVAGEYAKKSLEAGVADLKTKAIDGLVTAPISKEILNKQGFFFPGHTEFLAAKFRVKENLILMVKDKACVAVTTGHIPMAISEKLKIALISEKLQFIDSLRTDFKIKTPKVAVMGLNPHAGENGLLGNEEKHIIDKVVNIFNFNEYFVKKDPYLLMVFLEMLNI